MPSVAKKIISVAQPPAQREVEAALVAAQHRVEGALAPLVEAAVPGLAVGAQEARGHHRRQRQRYDHRDEDRHRQRHREFAEQAADDAPISSSGISTATSETLIDTMVNPISLAPYHKSAIPVDADLIMRQMVLKNQVLVGTVNADRAALSMRFAT